MAFLARAQAVLAAAGRAAEFPAIAADVRSRHGRKHNLMRLFEERGWSE